MYKVDIDFKPIDEVDQFFFFPANTNMETVFAELGLFKSNSQARKAGEKRKMPRL